MTGRTTLSSLLEMLADAAAMGAGKSDLMDKLQSRADAAHAFEAKAAPCLATVEASTAAASTQPADADIDMSAGEVDKEPAASTSAVDTVSAPPKKVSLAELEALVQEGQGIGIKLDSLTDLTRLLNTARAWTQQAEFCLTGKEPQTAKNRKHHQRPSLGKATSLVEELQSMAVTLPHAEELSNKQQQALKWVDRAGQVLEQGNLGQHLTDVQAVVGEGTAFGLEMPELTQLDALVKAIQWNSKVRAALRLKPDDTAQMATVTSSHQVGDAQHPATSRGSPAAAQAPLDPPATSSIIPATAPSSNDLPYAPELQTGSGDNPTASQQAGAGLVAQPGNIGQLGGMEQALSMSVLPLAERLSLAEAEELFEQGGKLPVEASLLQGLQTLMEAGQQWEAQVICHKACQQHSQCMLCLSHQCLLCLSEILCFVAWECVAAWDGVLAGNWCYHTCCVVLQPHKQNLRALVNASSIWCVPNLLLTCTSGRLAGRISVRQSCMHKCMKACRRTHEQDAELLKCTGCRPSSRLLPEEAPVVITEKLKHFFSLHRLQTCCLVRLRAQVRPTTAAAASALLGCSSCLPRG